MLGAVEKRRVLVLFVSVVSNVGFDEGPKVKQGSGKLKSALILSPKTKQAWASFPRKLVFPHLPVSLRHAKHQEDLRTDAGKGYKKKNRRNRKKLLRDR